MCLMSVFLSKCFLLLELILTNYMGVLIDWSTAAFIISLGYIIGKKILLIFTVKNI